jgi:hypothetical protein
VSEGSRPVAEINAVDRLGRRISVQFKWREDRYEHSICVVKRGVIVPLLESVEGDAETHWPPSPPFQHLSEPTVKGESAVEKVTMLTGGAGKSHWAMCVSARDHWIDRKTMTFQVELLFDVACRIKESPAWLGSTYRVLAGQAAISDERQLVRVALDSPACIVVPETSVVQLDTNSGARPVVRCKAEIPTCDKSPAETVRWQYAMRLSYE